MFSLKRLVELHTILSEYEESKTPPVHGAWKMEQNIPIKKVLMMIEHDAKQLKTEPNDPLANLGRP